MPKKTAKEQPLRPGVPTMDEMEYDISLLVFNDPVVNLFGSVIQSGEPVHNHPTNSLEQPLKGNATDFKQLNDESKDAVLFLPKAREFLAKNEALLKASKEFKSQLDDITQSASKLTVEQTSSENG
ncbi:uncharacterized protein [Watersipora subatra]|uniref:uncharacterized protein n=1 Tax=Watersipora subatra TaxID=2589382 RepID=UPI00355C2F03